MKTNTMTKEDISEYQKAYRQKNPDKFKAYRKKWAEANIEKVQAYQKSYQEANPDKFKAYNKKWREANREKCRAIHKAWKDANPERYRDFSKKWREENSEKLKTYSVSWREENQEKVILSLQQHRAGWEDAKSANQQWTIEEDQYLLENKELPRKELQSILGRSYSSISQRLSGLSKE